LQESLLKQSLPKAVLNDVQFWIPLAVLVLGIAVLMVVR
jgi:hypothetical protein